MWASQSFARSPATVGLISGSCSSARAFAPRFFQAPPRGECYFTLALRYDFTSIWLSKGLSPSSCLLGTIGIGGRVASPPLPHHRTCGSAYGGSVRLSWSDIQQSRKTERVEVSDRKSALQGGTVRQPPRPMGTAGGLCRKVNADVPLTQSSKPHRASLPLLPDHGSQPSPDPLIQTTQHRGRLAVAEVTPPST